MKNFSDERAMEKTEGSWKSPAMYTHVCGYKFCIGVDANGKVTEVGRLLVWIYTPCLGSLMTR